MYLREIYYNVWNICNDATMLVNLFCIGIHSLLRTPQIVAYRFHQILDSRF